MSILTRSHQMGAAALLLAAAAFFSRFMGLARDKIISYYYGAGTEADIYMAAFVVPDFINYLLAGGYFSITLIPILSRRFAENERSGWDFFSTLFFWVCVTSVMCVAVAWIIAPQLAHITAPGFIETPEKLERVTYFLRIILPAQIFFLPGACLTALLYLRRQFSPPALMPLIYNGCIIAGGLAVTWAAPERGMEGFCWGVIGGSFLGAFILPLMVARSGGLHIRLRFADKGFKVFIILALPLMLGQSITVLDEQLLRVFGSFAGVGSVSLLAYARRFMFVPIGLIAQAAGTAAYPFLASLAAEGNTARFAQTLNRVISSSITLAIPVCFCMGALSEHLVRLLFEQGRFTRADTEMCSLLLCIMLPAVVFWIFHQLVSRAFYAYSDTLTPAIAGTATTVLFLPVYWLLTQWLGAPGVALAGVLGIGWYTLWMAAMWRKKKGNDAFSGLGKCIAQTIAVSAAPGAIAWYAAAATAALFPANPFLGAGSALLAGGVLFGASYLMLALLFFPNLLTTLSAISKKLMRR